MTKDGDERARAAVGSLILPRYRDLRSFLRDVCGIEDDRGGGRTRGRGARFDEASALPPPPPELLDRFEAYYELRLPELYRRLLGSFHGADIIDAQISAGGATWTLGTFLLLLDDSNLHPDGEWDVEVVMSTFCERLRAQGGCPLGRALDAGSRYVSGSTES